MVEHGIYFGKEDLYDLIRNEGGEWNDSKERPIVCIIESKECKGLYWAIPMGNWNHRDGNAQNRINFYMSRPENDIRSCYYHVGNTDIKSIFFISDAIPITDKYIEREYLIKSTGNQYVVKNKRLLAELERKLFRVLSDENSKPNKYRQKITSVKNKLIDELNEKK